MYEDSYEVIAQDNLSVDVEALSELFELESIRYSRRLGEEDEARTR